MAPGRGPRGPATKNTNGTQISHDPKSSETVDPDVTSRPVCVCSGLGGNRSHAESSVGGGNRGYPKQDENGSTQMPTTRGSQGEPPNPQKTSVCDLC